MLNSRKSSKNLTYFLSNLIGKKKRKISKTRLGMKESHVSVVSLQAGDVTRACLVSSIEATVSPNFLHCFIKGIG